MQPTLAPPAHRAGQQYDLIQYGDSLTAGMRDNRDEVWDELLPPGEVLATPLGMGGSKVEVSGSHRGPTLA